MNRVHLQQLKRGELHVPDGGKRQLKNEPARREPDLKRRKRDGDGRGNDGNRPSKVSSVFEFLDEFFLLLLA
ncbi:hypothetical protein GCM10009000_041810 [Halobacterium noricense]